jgi:ABC-type Zn uptake system ZnuABC Zn-binding protein ZnuA
MVPRSRASFAVAVVAFVGAASLAACGGGEGPGAPGGAPVVVATTTQVGDLVRHVAGARATVREILRPNSDPHEYEPRPSDVRAIGGAAVVVRSGGDVDAWLTGVLDSAGSDARTLVLIDGMRTRRSGREVDPHWWQSPRNAIVAVARIRDALIAADPGGRDAYAANAGAYLARLRALDAAVASCIAKVPARERLLVTDHDALGYYAERYGVRVVGTVIPALSTQAQASAGEVARLVRTIRDAGVTTIFSQRSVNPKLTRAIARDAGARVGPALYADALGAKGTPGATYVGSVEANTRALVAGFSDGRVRCAL